MSREGIKRVHVRIIPGGNLKEERRKHLHAVQKQVTKLGNDTRRNLIALAREGTRNWKSAMTTQPNDAARDVASRLPAARTGGWEVSLDNAIKRACRDLPDGWQITISLEVGSGWPDLFDPTGTKVTERVYLDNLDLHEAINTLVEYARMKRSQPTKRGDGR